MHEQKTAIVLGDHDRRYENALDGAKTVCASSNYVKVVNIRISASLSCFVHHLSLTTPTVPCTQADPMDS
jgi:hypothetical protein